MFEAQGVVDVAEGQLADVEVLHVARVVEIEQLVLVRQVVAPEDGVARGGGYTPTRSGMPYCTVAGNDEEIRIDIFADGDDVVAAQAPCRLERLPG